MSVTRYVSAFALLLIVTPASSEWKPEYAQASPDRQQWFRSQRINPDAQQRLNVPSESCCDIGDVFKALFGDGNSNEDQWEYQDGEPWKTIPADIISNEPSLDNTPILFKNRLDGKELCFFKP